MQSGELLSSLDQRVGPFRTIAQMAALLIQIFTRGICSEHVATPKIRRGGKA